MKKKRKRTYRVVLLIVFALANALVLFGIGQIFTYFNTGADRSSILHTNLPDAKVYLPKVIWEDTLNPGRPIEKPTLSRITSHYLQSWYVKQVAYATNNPLGIKDFFTQNAQINLMHHIEDQQKKNITIASTGLQHNLSLDFYSADGQMAVISDREATQYQRIYKEDTLLLETKISSNYKAVLLLEDGFWKIRHIVKEASQNNIKQEIEHRKKLAEVHNKKIWVNGSPFLIQGINYYPQASPWNMFGDDFDIKIIEKDFLIIKDKGLNTVRVFIGYEDFGKAEVNLEKLNKLKQVLDKANQMKLKVIVTLFDFYGNYDVLDWTLTHRHVEHIVTSFKEHPAILAWDIKNEPNLDFESRGRTNVLAWLKEMILQVKKYDPNHLITIGWSNIESARLLANEIDFISFHYYLDLSFFEEKYLQLQQQVDKPLVLQEFGISSNKTFWIPFAPSEEKQASFYSDFYKIINEKEIHAMPWTLYDFTEVPSTVVGSLPWRKQQQKHFGFINKKGIPKKAFAFLGN